MGEDTGSFPGDVLDNEDLFIHGVKIPEKNLINKILSYAASSRWNLFKPFLVGFSKLTFKTAFVNVFNESFVI